MFHFLHKFVVSFALYRIVYAQSNTFINNDNGAASNGCQQIDASLFFGTETSSSLISQYCKVDTPCNSNGHPSVMQQVQVYNMVQFGRLLIRGTIQQSTNNRCPASIAYRPDTDSTAYLWYVCCSEGPTSAPTTSAPTSAPTTSTPTTDPTSAPTTSPTTDPTSAPTTSPTTDPTSAPTTSPTTDPTSAPTTSTPTTDPTTSTPPTPTPSSTKETTPGVSPAPTPDSYSPYPTTGPERNCSPYMTVIGDSTMSILAKRCSTTSACSPTGYPRVMDDKAISCPAYMEAEKLVLVCCETTPYPETPEPIPTTSSPYNPVPTGAPTPEPEPTKYTTPPAPVNPPPAPVNPPPAPVNPPPAPVNPPPAPVNPPPAPVNPPPAPVNPPPAPVNPPPAPVNPPPAPVNPPPAPVNPPPAPVNPPPAPVNPPPAPVNPPPAPVNPPPAPVNPPPAPVNPPPAPVNPPPAPVNPPPSPTNPPPSPTNPPPSPTNPPPAPTSPPPAPTSPPPAPTSPPAQVTPTPGNSMPTRTPVPPDGLENSPAPSTTVPVPSPSKETQVPPPQVPPPQVPTPQVPPPQVPTPQVPTPQVPTPQTPTPQCVQHMVVAGDTSNAIVNQKCYLQSTDKVNCSTTGYPTVKNQAGMKCPELIVPGELVSVCCTQNRPLICSPKPKPVVNCEANTYPVSVVGLGTFCVAGPICSGNVGTGNCPSNSYCDLISPEVYGCKQGGSATPAPAPAPTKESSPATGVNRCAYSPFGTYEASVEGVVGVFCAQGPLLCTDGNRDGKCPLAQPGLSSDSVCTPIASGVYGCKVAGVSQAEPAPGCINNEHGAYAVSVRGVGTYCAKGPIICSGFIQGSCPRAQGNLLKDSLCRQIGTLATNDVVYGCIPQ